MLYLRYLFRDRSDAVETYLVEERIITVPPDHDVTNHSDDEYDEIPSNSADALLKVNSILSAPIIGSRAVMASSAAVAMDADDDNDDDDDEYDDSNRPMRLSSIRKKCRTTRFLARTNLAIIGQTLMGRGASWRRSAAGDGPRSSSGVVTVADLVQERLKDSNNRRRRIARAKERRAFLVLGIVMASFIGCWLPFFSVYLVTSLIGTSLPDTLFDVFFWLGYCNSALNPIIYTIFNRDFRRAFKKIMCGKLSTSRF